MNRLVLAIILLCSTVSMVLSAVPTLDDIVNCMKLDQRSPAANRDSWSTVKPGNPVGQTFVTGPDVVTLSRVGVWVAGWNEEWSDGESLVLTVYDSPAKTKKLGSFAMPYKWKLWEGSAVIWPLDIPVEAGREYYFELTVEGGNGTIQGIFHASGDYPSGTRYEAGKPADGDLCFETWVKKTWDRDADYSYYFSHWNLDYPGLERVKDAVDRKDWDSACRELVAFYERRSDLVQPRTPTKNPDYDLTDADLAVNQQVRDQEGTIWHIGPDWNHRIQWPLRGGVGLTRTGIRKYLVGAYQNTADEKYARAFNDMILCNMRDQPSPIRSGVIPPGAKDVNPAPPAGIAGGSMWSALGVAARIGQLWYFYSGVVTSPSFTLDARCALLFNMVDGIDFLSIVKGGGNWDTQINDSLMEIGYTYPELKISKDLFARGVDGLIRNCFETVHPDGVLQEASMNYHGLVTNRFLQLLESADKLGISIPHSMRRRVERMIEYIMYSTEPMWICPGTGDTFNYFSGDEYLVRGAKYFGRSDMLWVGTKGTEGVPPLAASVAFKHGGWYIMRSGWDADARYMNIHNGPNRGHGHNDSLQMVVSAFGSELLIDPGVYVYGTPETMAISRTTAHSTITVDGKDAHTEAGVTTWESNSQFDYFDGTNRGYVGLDDVRMRRRIVFLKPDYWVVLDEVTGTGTHMLDSRFVCATGRASVKGRIARFSDGRNGLLVATPSDDSMSLAVDEGKWAVHGKLVPVPVIRKSVETPLPFATVQVLVPFKGADAPRVTVHSKPLPDDSLHVAILFPDTDRLDTVTFGADGRVQIKRDRYSR